MKGATASQLLELARVRARAAPTLAHNVAAFEHLGTTDVEFIFVAQQADDCRPSKFKDPDTGKVVFRPYP